MRRNRIPSIKCGIEDKAEAASIKSLKENQTTQTTKMKVPEDEKFQQQGSTIVEMLKAGSFVLKQNLVPKTPLQYKTTQALNMFWVMG